MENDKIKKTILCLIVGLFFALPAFATMEYPTIAGITISKTTTAAEYIVYFFNLAVAVGTFAAVVMIVMAGIEWMTSEGNPAKIESAKEKIKNTLLGVVILLGCNLILNMINPSLQNIQIDQLSCVDGIKVETDVDGEIKEVCISQTMSSIGFDVLSTKEWIVDSDSIYRVFTYPEEDFKGTPSPVSYGGDISGAKSIYFEWKKVGSAYLYNATDLNMISGTPLLLSKSISNLADYSFDNSTNSMRFMNPENNSVEELVAGHAIVFEDPNYRGSCSFVGSDVYNFGQSSGGYYSTPIGNNKLSSLIFFKVYGDQSKNQDGEIIFYNTTNCNESSGESCVIKLSGMNIRQSISDACGGEFGDVRSFKIKGPYGLVLMTGDALSQNSGKCQYWGLGDISRGTCKESIIGEDIFSGLSCAIGMCDRPRSFIAFPVDEK